MTLKELIAVAGLTIATGVVTDTHAEKYCFNKNADYIGKLVDGIVYDTNGTEVGKHKGKFLISERGNISAIYIYNKLYDMKGKQVAKCYRGDY